LLDQRILPPEKEVLSDPSTDPDFHQQEHPVAETWMDGRQVY
jgi:hypothetical protein